MDRRSAALVVLCLLGQIAAVVLADHAGFAATIPKKSGSQELFLGWGEEPPCSPPPVPEPDCSPPVPGPVSSYGPPPYSPAPAPSSSSPVTPSSPAYSSPPPSSPSPSYSPPYTSPAPSSSSPVTPSSPAYSYPPPSSPSPSYSPPYTSPAPSTSSPVTPSSPAYSSPPTYSSPAPSTSSPTGPVGPASAPYTSPSYGPPSGTPGTPDCPPLSNWFKSPSSGSDGWWKDQLDAQKHKDAQKAQSNAVAAADVPKGEKVVAEQAFFFGPGDGSDTPSTPYGDSSPSDGGYSPYGAATPAPDGGAPGTCDFWKTHASIFPEVLSIFTTILDLFGGQSGSIFGSTTTLMQGLSSARPDGFGSLLRQGSAAILNSYKFPGLYQFTPEAVKSSFRGALFSQQAAAVQAVIFENANRGFGN